MRFAGIVAAVVTLGLAGRASADVFGLGPTLLGKGPALVVEQRGASGPLPSQIVGLEGYALWGKNAGAAAAVTYKHQFAGVRVGERTVYVRYGVIAGVSAGPDVTKPLIGGFVEAEAEGLVGIVLVLRADDGLYLNPGLKVNIVSKSF